MYFRATGPKMTEELHRSRSNPTTSHYHECQRKQTTSKTALPIDQPLVAANSPTPKLLFVVCCTMATTVANINMVTVTHKHGAATHLTLAQCNPSEDQVTIAFYRSALDTILSWILVIRSEERNLNGYQLSKMHGKIKTYLYLFVENLLFCNSIK